MKYALAALALLLVTPLTAAAHATPVSYEPAAGAGLENTPERVVIDFTERLEPAASSIQVLDKDGSRIDSGDTEVDPGNPRKLSGGLKSGSEGIYTVSWQVVSADDGHFTKGAYMFSVGEDIAPVSALQQIQVTFTSRTDEGLAVTAELLGLALVLGCVILGRYFSIPSYLKYFGLIFIILGAGSYFVIKTLDLAAVQSLDFWTAFAKFYQTVAGEMTVTRLAGAVALLLPFVWRRKTISLLILLVMFYARVRSSHAAAAEFLPTFAMADHFLHLLSKSAWVGILLALALAPKIADRKFLVRVSKLLHLNIMIAAVTGAFIVWLDLKDLQNILTTDWGWRFIVLTLVGGALFLLRVYDHIFAANKYLRLEAAVGTAMLVATGFIMITTPPMLHKNLFVRQVAGDDWKMTMREHPQEPSHIQIKLENGKIQNAVIVLTNTEKNIGPIEAEIEKRAVNSVVFSKNHLSPAGRWKADITLQRESGYDAVASFEINNPHDFNHFATNARRSFDDLAILSTVGGLAVAAMALGLARREPNFQLHSNISWLAIVPAVIAGYVLLSFAPSLFIKTEFQKSCEQNGHFWHQMTPLRDGKILSQTAQPGCMLPDGQFHFADFEEYQYFIRPVNVGVKMTQRPSGLEFELRDEMGNPVTDLVITHEKLIHAIITNDGFEDFAHLHPEQIAPGKFRLDYSFPRRGLYLVALDFQVRSTPVSKIFTLGQDIAPPFTWDFAHREKKFFGYDVKLDVPETIFAGESVSFDHSISKNGEPVADLEPHLGAAMHIAVIKEDFSEFIHTHGEPQKISTQHAHVAVPAKFGPKIFSAVTFPAPGAYVILGEFKHRGQVIVTNFMIKVE